MGVRVTVKVKHGELEAETSALVNTGFETEQPEILLPLKLAERLGLHPPKLDSILQEYSVVGGTTILIKSSHDAQVAVKGREDNTVNATPLISDSESEVLISDLLASRLNIVIESAGEGLWRFRDEKPEEVRASSRPQHWS